MASDLHPADESLFWYWINERHTIYLRRAAGQAKPWTEDTILQSYKFTNVFRELDRGTLWLRVNFLDPHRDGPLHLLVANICWYRMFNLWTTGAALGWQTSWNVEEKIEQIRAIHGPVFTAAHIVHSDYGRPKIDSIVEVCANLWNLSELVAKVSRVHRSLETVFKVLTQVEHIGPFMGYEIVTDIRHTTLLEDATDIMTWANAGPGAIRGLMRLGLTARPARVALESMIGLLERSESCRGGHVPPLELRDIEHSLCEFDKYCRVKFGEGRPRGRYPGV